MTACARMRRARTVSRGRAVGWFRAALVTVLLLSQRTTAAEGGSLFAAEGLGMPRTGYDLAARAAGGTGIGRIDGYQMSVVNPASFAWSERAQVAAGFYTESVWVRAAGAEDSDRTGGTRLSGLVFALPWPKPIRLAAGYGDLTDGRFTIETRRDAGRETEHVRRVEGTGGIGRFHFDVALPLRDRVAVGFRVGTALGTLRESRADEFVDGSLLDTESVLRTRVEKGRTLTVGAQSRVSPWLSLGGHYGWGNEARLKSLFRSDTGIRTEQRIRFELPNSFGAGLSLTPMPRWELALDYAETRWSESGTSGDDGSGEAGATTLDSLADDRHFGVGIIRHPTADPARRNQVRSLLVWRLGFRWDELGLPARAEPIREWALTAGLGVPVQLDRGYLDAIVEIGRRGDRDAVGLEETFLMLGVGVTFQELRRAF